MTKIEARLSSELTAEVADLLLEHAEVIDRNELEKWPELYTEDGCYRVLSRENVELGLPAPLMYYYSQRMLRDRVTALRDALTYEFVYTCHVTSPPRLKLAEDRQINARTTFSIYQSTERGETRTFAVGVYEDVIVRVDGVLRFKRRDVILDTFAVPNNIAIPL